MIKQIKYLYLTFIVIALDQLSKIIIRNSIRPNDIIKVTPKLLWLTNIQNSGAAFSISIGSDSLNKIFFTLFTLIAAIFVFFIFKNARSKTEKIAFALILGGAIGNLIDRFLLGSVTDFVWCDFPDFIMQRWPIFNVADSSIVIAICILLVYFIFFEKKHLEDK